MPAETFTTSCAVSTQRGPEDYFATGLGTAAATARIEPVQTVPMVCVPEQFHSCDAHVCLRPGSFVESGARSPAVTLMLPVVHPRQLGYPKGKSTVCSQSQAPSSSSPPM